MQEEKKKLKGKKKTETVFMDCLSTWEKTNTHTHTHLSKKKKKKHLCMLSKLHIFHKHMQLICACEKICR